MIRLILIPFVLAAATTAQARPYDQMLTATVGWSEWCPPGTVHLDLETGRYEWLKQSPRRACATATAAPIERATLGPDVLVQVRVAVQSARRDGLVRPECRAGRSSPVPVVSNAGPPYVLVLSSSRDSISAPTDLGCWTDGAMRLQRVLERIFDLPRPPRKP